MGDSPNIKPAGIKGNHFQKKALLLHLLAACLWFQSVKTMHHGHFLCWEKKDTILLSTNPRFTIYKKKERKKKEEERERERNQKEKGKKEKKKMQK
jgi:hypothetical protein